MSTLFRIRLGFRFHGNSLFWLLCLLLCRCQEAPTQTFWAKAESTNSLSVLAKRGTLQDRVILTGELEAIASENLSVPRTPVWLLSILWLAEDGAVVKKGDPVVEFDASALVGNLEDKRLSVLRAENELSSETSKAASSLADKTMEVERKRAEFAKAKIASEQPADLISRWEFQKRQQALSQAADLLAKAEEDLTAQKQINSAERTLKEVARDKAVREFGELGKRQEDLTLRAPRDGLLQIAINRRERRRYLVGDKGYPGSVVAALPDLSTIAVHARLSDVDDGAVQAGMAAECILDAYPDKRWKGSVEKLSPMARTDGRDILRRFFDVMVRLDDVTPELLRPGMSVRVEILRQRAEGAIIVPRAALRISQKGSAILLRSGAEAPVELDFCTELECAVRSGIAEGTALHVALPQEKAPL